MSEHQYNLEIELRYKVHDPETTMRALAAIGIAHAGRSHLIDQWFMPKTIHSLAEEEQWFDHEKGVAWRIRRTEQPDGTYNVEVTSKQLTEANNHNTFTEGRADITDYQTALAFMAKKGYRCWLTIDKTRYAFAPDRADIEIVLDVIAGLAEKIGVGAALEIEYKGGDSRDEALALLNSYASSVGLNPADQFDRSLTVEAMSELADFGTPDTQP